MTNQEIIRTSLSFLIDIFGFEYKYICNGIEYYYLFQRANGTFTIYECPQFQDRIFYISIINHPQRQINIFQDYEQLFEEWNLNHSGIKWFFKDKRKDYWDMIAKLIKSEIEKTDTLFGIKLR